MTRAIPAIALAVALIIAFCLSAAAASGIKPEDVAGKPQVLCEVTKEPNPLFLGGWKCRATGVNPQGIRFDNPVEYWLVKYDDQYALYYYYKSPKDQAIGWMPFILNGDEILFPNKQMKFIAKDGNVYFVGKYTKEPTRMTRIESK